MFEYNNVNISKMNKDELIELKELIENEIDDINLMLKINIVGMFNFASLSLFLLFKEYLKYSNGYNVFDSKEIDRFILILSLLSQQTIFSFFRLSIRLSNNQLCVH